MLNHTTISPSHIKIYGMMRSGHHAIMEWIAAQFYKKAAVFHRPNLEQVEKFKNLNSSKYVIYNCEDYIPQIKDGLNILVLRDLYNLFASRLRHQTDYFDESKKNHKKCTSEFGLFTKPALSLWKTYATCYQSKKWFNINYNKWFSNKEYRKSLSKQLGGTFNDSTIQNVSVYGGGSSFDKTKHNGRAQEMNTNLRFQKYINNERYQRFFDENSIKLNLEIFGENKPWK